MSSLGKKIHFYWSKQKKKEINGVKGGNKVCHENELISSVGKEEFNGTAPFSFNINTNFHKYTMKLPYGIHSYEDQMHQLSFRWAELFFPVWKHRNKKWQNKTSRYTEGKKTRNQIKGETKEITMRKSGKRSKMKLSQPTRTKFTEKWWHSHDGKPNPIRRKSERLVR